jgi:hypothetical protein
LFISYNSPCVICLSPPHLAYFLRWLCNEEIVQITRGGEEQCSLQSCAVGTGYLSGITFTQEICCLHLDSIIDSPLTDVSGTPGSYFNPSRSGKYRKTSWGVIIVHIAL